LQPLDKAFWPKRVTMSRYDPSLWDGRTCWHRNQGGSTGGAKQRVDNNRAELGPRAPLAGRCSLNRCVSGIEPVEFEIEWKRKKKKNGHHSESRAESGRGVFDGMEI